MTQYIPKSALVAEIERRIKTNKECMLGLRNLDYYQGKVDALKDTLSSLNTLEVKEVDFEKESLTSEDISNIYSIVNNLIMESRTGLAGWKPETLFSEALKRFKTQK